MPKRPKKKPSAKQKPKNVVQFEPAHDDVDDIVDALPFDRDFTKELVRRMSEFEEHGEITPLEMAQGLIGDAWEEEDPLKRFALVQTALEICPDCTDAYLLLAQEYTSALRYEIEMLEEGVYAAERVLGPEPFQKSAGHFWELEGTRPYMRARAALAHTLWEGGHDDDAIDHARDLLRLNTGDNQGIRYALIHWLIETGRDYEAQELIDNYGEEASATWHFSRALLEFRKSGDTKKSRGALETAIDSNAHVLEFLTGREMPEEEPAFYSPGDEREAVIYCRAAFQSWYRSSDALEWLRQRAT